MRFVEHLRRPAGGETLLDACVFSGLEYLFIQFTWRNVFFRIVIIRFAFQCGIMATAVLICFFSFTFKTCTTLCQELLNCKAEIGTEYTMHWHVCACECVRTMFKKHQKHLQSVYLSQAAAACAQRACDRDLGVVEEGKRNHFLRQRNALAAVASPNLASCFWVRAPEV